MINFKFSFPRLNNFNKGSCVKFCKKKWVLIIFVWMLFFLTFSINLPAAIWYNGSDTTFDYMGELNKYVITGAANFLQSYSSFLLLLSHAELGVNDLQIGKKYLETAIESLEDAINIYEELKQKAESSENKQSTIEDLKKIDYDSLKKKNRLIETIFKSVRGYLEKGEIPETYKIMLAECNTILKTLKILHEQMNKGIFPEKSKLWDINHSYSESMFFGEYVARVFNEITKKREKTDK